ncbi:hypothetical protein [Dyella telluris]|uniref:Uncharacterized protein n=1 Tax=Dyella telluris TaxID=2763498 RepID=A0A7G8Q6M2_9GAMM|nr:hypothetical protein [Dyella telluris]QNK02430.1 hypothetical protein H8F01_04605 [Dyella telluris]
MSTIRRPNDPVTDGLSPNVSPSSQFTPDEMAAIAEAEYKHVDYDRHPLRVQGLDHYFNYSEGNERFHIS